MLEELATQDDTGTEVKTRRLPEISHLFGPGVITAVTASAAGLDELCEAERSLVANAHPARQSEFATGRLLARRLLARLGVAPAPLLIGRDRAPQWPDGVVGSLSHAGGVCAVALAGRSNALALGLDLEPSQPLAGELCETICAGRELQWLNSRAPSARGLLARLIFSAKECVYKCQFPLTETALEFEDLEIDLDLGRSRFVARFRRDAGATFPRAAKIQGSFRRSAEWIATGVVLPPEASS